MAVKIQKAPAVRKREKSRYPEKTRQALIDRIFKLVMSGSSLVQACASDRGYPSHVTLHAWMSQDAELRAAYDLALEIAQDERMHQIERIPASIEIGDVSYVKDGKRVEIRTADRIAKAALEMKSKQWTVSRRDAKTARPEPQDGGAGFNADVRVYICQGGLPTIPLGELASDEERQAAIDEMRLPQQWRDGRLLADSIAMQAQAVTENDQPIDSFVRES